MPELSRFDGIIVRMYYNDYPPPHFHVAYGDYKAKIAIGDWEVLRGRLPPRAMARVADWAESHRNELLSAWTRTMNHLPPNPIES